jgi:hypothetical protein
LTAKNGVVRVGHGLTLGGLADQALAILGEGDDRRRGARAFRIFDNLGLAAVHDCDAAVGGAEVDTDSTLAIKAAGGTNGGDHDMGHMNSADHAN